MYNRHQHVYCIRVQWILLKVDCLGSFVYCPFLTSHNTNYNVCHELTLVHTWVVCCQQRLHSTFTQSSFVRSSTWTFIRLLVQLILSPSLRPTCHRSHHRLQISLSINGFFLVYWRAWLTAFCLYILNTCIHIRHWSIHRRVKRIFFEWKGVNMDISPGTELFVYYVY